MSSPVLPSIMTKAFLRRAQPRNSSSEWRSRFGSMRKARVVTRDRMNVIRMGSCEDMTTPAARTQYYVNGVDTAIRPSIVTGARRQPRRVVRAISVPVHSDKFGYDVGSVGELTRSLQDGDAAWHVASIPRMPHSLITAAPKHAIPCRGAAWSTHSEDALAVTKFSG
jgi:hypothetical protein